MITNECTASAVSTANTADTGGSAADYNNHQLALDSLNELANGPILGSGSISSPSTLPAAQTATNLPIAPLTSQTDFDLAQAPDTMFSTPVETGSSSDTRPSSTVAVATPATNSDLLANISTKDPQIAASTPYHSTDSVQPTVPTNHSGHIHPTGDSIPTHGFVHGHIHKHKDHTHIHGHIHNHDHDTHFESHNSNVEQQDCDYELECKDMFCDELDDCFFINCEDSLLNQKITKPAYDEVSTDLSYHFNDSTNCQPQANKIIFEDLINNVNNNLSEDLPLAKRKKTNNFQIHYPHQCHPPALVDPDSTDDHHHFHQLCFHATIPNEGESSSAATPGSSSALPSVTPAADPASETNLMSDYDFFVQFNNFNQLMNSTAPESNYYVENNAISCQWDNCFKMVNDGNFVDHLLNDHISQDFIEPSKTYQCEWRNCNFQNRDLRSLLTHVNSHKYRQNEPLANSLTPNSTEQESPESVNITAMKIMPKKRSSAIDFPIDANFTCKWEVGEDENGKAIPCNKTHESAGDLQNHLINDHIGSGKSIYNCRWIDCERHNGKIFTQRQKLLRHIHIHTNYKPCKCDICGASFAVELMLKQHLRIHSGEKPFSCQICNKKFTTSSSLSIHNRVHTGEKPLICKHPGCGKRFSESSNLTKHMKIHLKIYKCDVCGEEFDKKPSYTRHMKVHKDSIPDAKPPPLKT